MGRETSRQIDKQPPSSLKLLESAASKMDSSEVLELVRSVDSICSKRRLRTWCAELLDDLADLRPSDLALDRAWVLAGGETLADARKSLRFLETYEQLRQSSSQDAGRASELARLARLQAQVTMASFGVGANWASLRRPFDLQYRRSKSPMVADAYLSLIDVITLQGRHADVIALIDDLPQETRQWREVEFDSWLWRSAIANSDVDRIRTAAEQLLRRAKVKGHEKPVVLAAVFSRDNNWSERAREFILGTHDHRNLIAIIFMAMSNVKGREEANEFLDGVWKSVAPETWPMRLRNGDGLVWYEMLLGHYLDKSNIQRQELMEALSDDHLFASSKFAFLPFPRNGMMCEFHFTMRSKPRRRANVIK